MVIVLMENVNKFVIDETDQPGDIISDDQYVYWVSSKGLSRQLKTGGITENVVSINASNGSLVNYDNSFYFTSKNMTVIKKYTVDPCCSVSDYVQSNKITSLAINPEYLIYLEYYGFNDPTNPDPSIPGNKIRRVKLLTAHNNIISQEIDPQYITIDNEFIYFGEKYYGAIFRIPIGGGSSGAISINDSPVKITISNDYVYWANSEYPSGIYRTHNSGELIKEKLADAVSAWGVTLYNQHLYWTDKDGNTVNKVSIGGGDNEEIASHQDSPKNIYTDQHAIYWSSNVGITKLVK